MTVAQERVAAGAAWLDEHKPGWERTLDLATLDLADGCHCVLGQAFQEECGISVNWEHDRWWWSEHYQMYNAFSFIQSTQEDGWAIHHGFDVSRHSRYPELQEAWLELIKNRFDTGTLSDMS